MSSVQSGANPGADVELNPLSRGTLFHGCYEVVRCLGAGGMGAVYEVMHSSTQRRRVLKTMLPTLLSDPDMRSRFKQEATITAGIESDHIVEVFDAGFDVSHGLPFLVMEYLRGENLAGVLRRQGRLEAQLVVTLLHQASLALDRTHSAGIVHRDLKPENLFLTQRDDGSPRLKLLDFGIAKVVAQSANLNTTRSFGTPLYMSPEQVRGDGTIDGRADVYALGQIAFTLLVGHAYWTLEAENTSGLYALLLKVVDGAPDPASVRANWYDVRLPAAFDAWYSRATHRLPSERFDSASELVEDLARALGVAKPRVMSDAAPLLRPASDEKPWAKSQTQPSEAQQVPTLAAVSDTSAWLGKARGSSGRIKHGRLWVLPLTLALVAVPLVVVATWHRTPLPGTRGSAATGPLEVQAPATTLTTAVLGSEVLTDAPRAQDAGAIEAHAADGSISNHGSSVPSAVRRSVAGRAKLNRAPTAKTSGRLGEDPSDLR